MQSFASPASSPPSFTVSAHKPAICLSSEVAVYPIRFASRTSAQAWVRLLRFSHVKAIRSSCNNVLRLAHLDPLPPLHSSVFSSRTSSEYLKLRSDSIQIVLQAAVDACVTRGHPLYCNPELLIGLGIDDLWRAAAYNDVSHMQLLISLSWGVDRCTPFGATPLHFACAFNSSDALSFLLKHQASPASLDSFGFTPHQLSVMAKLPVAYRLSRCRCSVSVVVVLNPFSGTRKSPEIVETIVEPVLRALQEWGVTFDVIRTEASKHAVSIARSCSADVIMCVSGDGIVHEVLNGLYQAHPELSDAKEGAKGLLHTALVHIPGGTGNGLSLSLGCSSALDAVMNVFNGRCAPHDVALLQQPSSPPYLSFLSVAWGLVSDVDLESERFRYLGDLRLDVAAVSSIISRKAYRCTIQYLPAEPVTRGVVTTSHSPHVCGGGSWTTIDGEQWYSITDDVQLFLAANCSWVAADFNAAPFFAFGDGCFDLIILREHRECASASKVAADRTAMISFFLKLGSAGWINSALAARHVEYVKVKAFKLIPDERQAAGPTTQFDVDGERIQSQDAVTASVLPCAVTLAGMAATGPVDAHVAVHKQHIAAAAGDGRGNPLSTNALLA